MTTEECHGKSGDEDWHGNGEAKGETETVPKESDPLQPKSLKLKATKEVKEVRTYIFSRIKKNKIDLNIFHRERW